MSARSLFLKDLKPIPLKCHHQKGWGLCSTVSVGGQNPNFDNHRVADTAAQSTFSLPWLYWGPECPFLSLTLPFKCPVTSVPMDNEYSLCQTFFPIANVQCWLELFFSFNQCLLYLSVTVPNPPIRHPVFTKSRDSTLYMSEQTARVNIHSLVSLNNTRGSPRLGFQHGQVPIGAVPGLQRAVFLYLHMCNHLLFFLSHILRAPPSWPHPLPGPHS